MGRYVAGCAPEMDELVDAVAWGVGRQIEAMRIPRLRGVVLGGGYARGEGGVREVDGHQTLSNDLDFYVVAEDGSSDAELAAIGDMLAPVSESWTRKVGVDVDFCPAKTHWRMKHDRERVMIQELLHGYFDVAGEKGETLFAGIERRGPEMFPWMESARLLMNRGMGLLLAKCKMENVKCKMGSGICANQNAKRKAGVDSEAGESVRDFVNRNINKCILGAGDARLIARHAYAWRATDRARNLGDSLYMRAVEWKFRPSGSAVCDWKAAREAWLAAEDEVMRSGDAQRALGRSVYQAARWVARRKTLGDVATLGQDCVVRVLKRISRAVREGKTASDSLMRDWEVFN